MKNNRIEIVTADAELLAAHLREFARMCGEMLEPTTIYYLMESANSLECMREAILEMKQIDHMEPTGRIPIPEWAQGENE